MAKRLIAQAAGDFPFVFYIEKAVASDEGNEMYVQGIASTTNVDHDSERMSEKALKQMATIINTESVPLRIEHQKGNDAIVGKVFKAWIDDRNQLWIKALLDKAHPVASLLHKSLKEGVKLGLSVGGRVKRATRELVESVGKQVNTFFDIMIDEVSVTQRPANYDAWLFAKSIAKQGDDIQSYYNTRIYNQFLFENPQLNYLQVFEKSVPNSAWMSVEKESNMNPYRKQSVSTSGPKETTEVTKEDLAAVTDTTSTAKDADLPKPGVEADAVLGKQGVDEARATETVTETAVKSLSKAMAEGFTKLTRLIAKMTDPGALDATNPTTDKVDPELGKDGETPAETVVGGQVDPVTKDDITPMDTTTTKDDVFPTDTTTTKDEVVPTDMTTTKDEPPVVSAPDTTTTKDDTYGGDYKMPELKSALKAIDTLTYKLSKRSEEWKGYAPVRKSVPAIDQFVFAINDALHAIHKNMEQQGKRILGLDQAIAETIRNDTVLQKSIKDMMTEPGAKKSVSMGIPYMVSKDGRKYALTASEIGVEKSVKNEGKSFKEVYKTQFSSEVEK
jgi:hypothetical protein